MMPRTGDHYFNTNHFHGDSLKEALKLKMLNQEDTFKKQVQELHRLYQMQMMLMKNFQWKGAVTKQSVNCSSQGILQRPLDAQLSASGYVKHIGHHFLNKGDGWGTRENPVQVECYCHGDSESSLDEVDLSLSIGGDARQKRSRRKVWVENFTSVSSQEIIDLEEPSHTGFSGEIEPMPSFGCIAGSTKPGDLQGFSSSCISLNGTNKDLDNGIKRCESFKDECKTYLEQNSSNQGVTKWLGELPPVTKVYSSREALCLDLNKPFLDESLSDSKDLELESSVAACSAITERVVGDLHKGTAPEGGTSWRGCDNNCSNEVSAIIQQDTPDTVMMDSNSTHSSSNTGGGKALSPDLESNLRLPPDCCEIRDCLTGGSQHKDPDLGSTLSRRNEEDQTMVGVNDEDIMGDENAVFSQLGCTADGVEDRDSSPSSCKSDYVTRDHACSLKTVQSGIYPGKSDLCRTNSSPNSESSENESPSPGESKSGSSDENKEGSAAHNDSLVQKGAVSLMYLFLDSSRREQDHVPEPDGANEKRDQPQCSSDTFESMVLKLKESNTEDYCVTSTPQEAVGMDNNKDYGVKLRRGRRMKDFQKDILPSLASLSRHEISEDVRIMEGVIRSREYKRLRSKTSGMQNWFTPVRSRRSRLNYVGRKYYS